MVLCVLFMNLASLSFCIILRIRVGTSCIEEAYKAFAMYTVLDIYSFFMKSQYFIKDELSELWDPDFGLFVQYGLGRRVWMALLLIYDFHITEQLRATDQKRVLYSSLSDSMETLLEPNQILAQ